MSKSIFLSWRHPSFAFSIRVRQSFAVQSSKLQIKWNNNRDCHTILNFRWMSVAKRVSGKETSEFLWEWKGDFTFQSLPQEWLNSCIAIVERTGKKKEGIEMRVVFLPVSTCVCMYLWKGKKYYNTERHRYMATASFDSCTLLLLTQHRQTDKWYMKWAQNSI